MEEWKKDNQEHLQDYEKQRYINNPRTEYKKQYREDNKDLLNEKNKQYRKEHPEYFKEYINKEYRKNNPEYFQQYDEKKKDKIRCECGKVITRGSISRHLKTNKHKYYLNKINIENVSSTPEETDNTELQKTNEQTSRETTFTQ